MESIAYVRVSTQEQADTNKSLANQEQACRDYAAHKNLDIAKVFIEEGESAKTADRTKLKEMMNFLKDSKGGIKNVIVWKVDRLARNTSDHLMLTGMFAKMGARLHSVTEPLEDTPAGKLMEHILASFAEFDNSVRAERSSKGMQSRLLDGGWVHIAPIGYVNFKDYLGRPTIKPDLQAKGVTALLNEFSTGLYRQIDAAERARSVYGIKTKYGNDISNNAVYKMLRSPIYAGFVHGKGLSEPIKGLHQAIISEDTYRINQSILNGKKPKLPRIPTKYDADWSLRKHLKCAYCGNGLTGSVSKGRGNKPHAYYHCTKCKGAAQKTKHLRLRKTETEEAYLGMLAKARPPPHVMKLFRQILFRWWNNEYKHSADIKHIIENKIQLLENKKVEFNSMYADGAIESAEELKQSKDKLNDEIDSLKLELITASEVYARRDEAIDLAIDFMANGDKMWRIAKENQKGWFQKMVFPDGISVNENLKFGTAQKGLIYQEAHLIEAEYEATKKTQNDSESLMVIPPGIEPGLPG